MLNAVLEKPCTIDVIAQPGDMYVFGCHIIDIHIHRRDRRTIYAVCEGVATPLFLAEYDSEEKAMIAFGEFRLAIMNGADSFQFPDNNDLDDRIRSKGSKGYSKTTGKTK